MFEALHQILEAVKDVKLEANEPQEPMKGEKVLGELPEELRRLWLFYQKALAANSCALEVFSRTVLGWKGKPIPSEEEANLAIKPWISASNRLGVIEAIFWGSVIEKLDLVVGEKDIQIRAGWKVVCSADVLGRSMIPWNFLMAIETPSFGGPLVPVRRTPPARPPTKQPTPLVVLPKEK